MRCLWCVAFIFAVGVFARAEGNAKRPITHEDVWTMRRLGGPTVSPDGKWAIVSVTEPAYDAKEESTDLWIVPTNGNGEARRLTATRAKESDVDWSPDSRRIVFSSKREGDEAAQLYVLDLTSGGDAERVTQLSTGARGARWSPDGKTLLFISDVYPETRDDAANVEAARKLKDRKYNVRAYETFPIRSWDRWLDERRTHLFVQEAQVGSLPRDLLAGTTLAGAPGFGGRLSDSGEDLPATWSPDGKSILFVATTNQNQAAYSDVNTQLFSTAVSGGEPVVLTHDAANYGRPIFAPDGKSFVVTRTQNDPAHEYSLRRLALCPWPFDNGQVKNLTAELDRDVGEPIFAADGEHIYFTVEDAGLEKLYSVSTAERKTRLEYEPSSGVITNLAGGGVGGDFRLVMLWDSATKPAEVFALTPGQTRPRSLTHFNQGRVAGLDLYPVEHYSIRDAQGVSVHSLIIRPANFDPNRKYPVIAVVHGGPHLMARDSFSVRWNYHLLAGTEYVVVATNYKGSTGFGEAFSREIQGDPLKGPAEQVVNTITAVTEHFNFADKQRIAALGASYGAHLVNWLEATTTRFRCLVAHAGLVNLEAQWATSDVIYDRERMALGSIWEQSEIWRAQNPIRLAGNHAEKTGWSTPILVTAGEKDFRVPLNNALEEWAYLQRLQVPSRVLIFPDENHWIMKGEDSRYWYGEVRGWLKRWMAPAYPSAN